MSFLFTESDRGKYSLSGVNCVLGPSKAIRYSGDFVIAGFVIAGFVIAGFVSIYFTGFQMLFVITGSSL